MIDLWQTKDLQHALGLLLYMEGRGITDPAAVKDILQRTIDQRLLELRKTTVSARVRRPGKISGEQRHNGELVRVRTVCSACSGPAIAERVNICPSTTIGGPWKSSISCTSAACRHIEMTVASLAEIEQQKGVA